MPTRLNDRGANLAHGWVVDDPLSEGDVSNLMKGVDRQAYGALKYVGGDGVIEGGTIDTNGQVGPTKCIVGGWVGVTSGNTAIEGLTNGKTNTIWAVRVDVPEVGDYAFDPDYDTTFNSGALRFLAQDSQPPNSFKLGTATVDGSGNVTAVDNTVLDRPTVLEGATKTWTGSVTVTGLAEGSEVYVEVDHSSDITFAAKLLAEYTNSKPSAQGGFTVRNIENCQPGVTRFLLQNDGSAGSYYGDTSVTIYWSITGVPA
jgi:hypothetical protein